MASYPNDMIFDKNDHIGRQLSNGGYELDLLNDVNYIISEIKSHSLVLDIGAHVGNLSCFISSKINPFIEVYAFEPNIDTFQYLHKNSLNFKFKAFNLGITDEMDYCNVINGPKGNSGMSKITSGNSIKCIMLDEFPLPAKNIALIKIDVEGSEMSVLRTMPGILSSTHKPVLICEAHDELKFTEINDYLCSFNYSCTGHSYCATPTFMWVSNN
jgi:FkbM family methyltransferase